MDLPVIKQKVKRKIKKIVRWEKYLLLRYANISLWKRVKFYLLPLRYWPDSCYTYNYTKIKHLLGGINLENARCGVCQKNEYILFGKKDGLNIVQCGRCGHYYVNPHILTEKIVSLYNKNYLEEQLLYPEAREKLQIRRVKTILEFCLPEGKLLDVGSGPGLFLNQARKEGFSTYALEINSEAKEFLKEKGHNLAGSDLKEADVNNTFDVITLFELIEHLPEPLNGLKKCYQLLKPGGILAISTPNFAWALRRRYNLFWSLVKPTEHLQLFTPDSIFALLKECGFRILDLRTDAASGLDYEGGMLILAVKDKKDEENNTVDLLIIRKGARGDVLLATPVIKALKEKFPLSFISVLTDFPEMLEHNPFVNRVMNGEVEKKYDFIFNLKYETTPQLHIVDAYAMQCNVKIGSRLPIFCLTQEEKEKAKNILAEKLKTTIVVVHTGRKNEEIRRWTKAGWRKLAILLKKLYKAELIQLGSKDDLVLENCTRYLGKLTIRESAGILSYADLFIGIDSVFLHLAQSLGVPCVGIFGSRDPQTILTAQNALGVQSNFFCKNCYNFKEPPVFGIECRWRKPKCMKRITPQMVMEAIEKLEWKR